MWSHWWQCTVKTDSLYSGRLFDLLLFAWSMDFHLLFKSLLVSYFGQQLVWSWRCFRFFQRCSAHCFSSARLCCSLKLENFRDFQMLQLTVSNAQAWHVAFAINVSVLCFEAGRHQCVGIWHRQFHRIASCKAFSCLEGSVYYVTRFPILCKYPTIDMPAVFAQLCFSCPEISSGVAEQILSIFLKVFLCVIAFCLHWCKMWNYIMLTVYY